MTDSIVKLANVRLGFGDGIWKARASEDGKNPKFSCSLIFPPDHPCVPALKKAMIEAATAKWGAKAQETLKALVAGQRVCLRNGDDKANYDGFEGNLYISASSKARPLVIDADKSQLTESDGRPYSGCYVNATVSVWAQDNKFGKRVNAQLRGVQFFKDGDAFGGGAPATTDEFEDVSGEGADAAAPTGADEDDIFG